MNRSAYSPRQSTILEILYIVLLVFLMGYGLVFQLERWSLPGSALILVGIFIVNVVNLVQARFSSALARIEALETQLAALQK